MNVYACCMYVHDEFMHMYVCIAIKSLSPCGIQWPDIL